MLRTVQVKLILSAMLFFGTWSSGPAQLIAHSPSFNHDINSDDTSSLTEQEIINAYHLGVSIGATHMLTVWITDVDDPSEDYVVTEECYNFIIFCYPGVNVNDLIKTYNSFSTVSQVFALHLGIDEQLGSNPWNTEYP